MLSDGIKLLKIELRLADCPEFTGVEFLKEFELACEADSISVGNGELSKALKLNVVDLSL